MTATIMAKDVMAKDVMAKDVVEKGVSQVGFASVKTQGREGSRSGKVFTGQGNLQEEAQRIMWMKKGRL